MVRGTRSSRTCHVVLLSHSMQGLRAKCDPAALYTSGTALQIIRLLKTANEIDDCHRRTALICKLSECASAFHWFQQRPTSSWHELAPSARARLFLPQKIEWSALSRPFPYTADILYTYSQSTAAPQSAAGNRWGARKGGGAFVSRADLTPQQQAVLAAGELPRMPCTSS